MRLYRRGQGKNWWLDVRYRGKRHHFSTHISNQKRANEFARDFIAKLHRGEYRADESSVTFERLCELSLNYYRINDRRSIKTFGYVLKRLSREFSQVCAIDITSERIERYKAERISQAAKSTINEELSALSLMFRLAVEQHQLLARKPLISFLDDSDNVRQGFVAQGDYLAIRAALPQRLQDLTDFLWWTGVRLGTARQIEWRDINHATIRIRSETVKTNQSHEIPLLGEVAAIIHRANEYRTPLTRLVFNRNGQPLLNNWCEVRWKKAARAVGLAHILIHDLRRSFVRNMRLAGLPEAVIMQFTGHRTRDVFLRYNIVNMDEKRAAIERLEEYLSGQTRERNVAAFVTAQTAAARKSGCNS
jgi:integrase